MTVSTEGRLGEVYLDDRRVSDCLHLLRARRLKGHLLIAHDLGCSCGDSRLCFYTQHIKIYLQLLYYHLLKDCGWPLGSVIAFAT